MDVTNPSHSLYGILQSEVFPTLIQNEIISYRPLDDHAEVVRMVMSSYESNTLHRSSFYLKIGGWAFVWSNNVPALKRILDNGASLDVLIRSVLEYPWYDKTVHFSTIRFLQEQGLKFDDLDASKFLLAAMYSSLSHPFQDARGFIEYIVRGGFPKPLLYEKSSIAHLAGAVGNAPVLQVLFDNGMSFAEAYWGFYGAATMHNIVMMEWFVQKGMLKWHIAQNDYIVFVDAMRQTPNHNEREPLTRTWDMVRKMGITPEELAPQLSALIRAVILHHSNRLLVRILEFFGDRARRLRIERDRSIPSEMLATLEQWGIIHTVYVAPPTRTSNVVSMAEMFARLAEQFHEARREREERPRTPSRNPSLPPIRREEWSQYNYRMFRNAVLKGDIETLKQMRDIKLEDIRRSDIRILRLAATSGSVEVFRYLWNKGCTLDDLRSNNGELLDIAVHHGHLALINLFREYGLTYADANAGAFSSYLLAQTEGSTDVIEIFDSWNQVPIECPDLEMTCGICLDALISTANNVLVPTILHTTPCHHSFHKNCIMTWMKREPTCPTCRKEVSKGVHHEITVIADTTVDRVLAILRDNQGKISPQTE